MITRAQWLGPYAAHPAAQAQAILANGDRLLGAVNHVLGLAEADGVHLVLNPATGSLVSGQGNGGLRPPDCTVGAPRSQHKNGNAVDVYDPTRQLMAWLLADGARLLTLGVWIEHPQWCHSWAHLQSVPPAGWTLEIPRRVFLPYADLTKFPPTCGPLPAQRQLGLPEYRYLTPPNKP